MHDIGRTQLEQQTFGEYETGELEGGEYESGEYESGELEGAEISPELESPLSEMQEMELASELLEVTNEQELEQFLGDVFNTIGQAAGNFLRSDTGQALGGILKDSLSSAAKQALPVVGRAIGDVAGGYGDIGPSRIGRRSTSRPGTGRALRRGPRVRDSSPTGSLRRLSSRTGSRRPTGGPPCCRRQDGNPPCGADLCAWPPAPVARALRAAVAAGRAVGPAGPDDRALRFLRPSTRVAVPSRKVALCNVHCSQ